MRRKTDYRQEAAASAVLSAAGGIGATLLCLVLFSVLMTKIDFSDGIVSAASKLAVCVGSYFSAYLLALKKRRHGILTGLAVGGAFFLFSFLGGLILSAEMAFQGIISRLLLILLCGIIGGVVGVNSKWKRY